jgi:transcriptional regulator with XRE-family HTH domain
MPMESLTEHSQEVHKAIGLAIREKRIQLGMTQEQLMEKSDVHKNTIVKFEGGKRAVSLDVLIRLCAALDLNLMTVAVD